MTALSLSGASTCAPLEERQTTPTYSAPVVTRARILAEAGWNSVEIVGLIEREFGVSPSRGTVWKWAHPERAELLLGRDAARRRQTRPVLPRHVSPEVSLKRMRLLRERGLSYRAIATVSAVWWGEQLAPETVAYRLKEAAAGMIVS